MYNRILDLEDWLISKTIPFESFKFRGIYFGHEDVTVYYILGIYIDGFQEIFV